VLWITVPLCLATGYFAFHAVTRTRPPGFFLSFFLPFILCPAIFCLCVREIARTGFSTAWLIAVLTALLGSAGSIVFFYVFVVQQ